MSLIEYEYDEISATGMGQLAQELHRRPQGGLSSDTVPNPKEKEQCHAVTFRSGKKLEEPIRREAESYPTREEQAGHNQFGSKDRSSKRMRKHRKFPSHGTRKTTRNKKP